jgi:hypothetical protein
MYILLQWQKYSTETANLKYVVRYLMQNRRTGKGRVILDQKMS